MKLEVHGDNCVMYDATRHVPLVLQQRHSVPDQDNCTVQILRAGTNLVVLLRVGSKIVQRATVPADQECHLNLDPNAPLFPLGDVRREVMTVLAGHSRYAKCNIVSLPFVHTQRLAPNVRTVVTDGRAVSVKGGGYDHDWHQEYDDEHFEITACTYAIVISRHTGIIDTVYLWEGVDSQTVLAAIHGVIAPGS